MDDSESDWSLTGDWQRIVSLIIAIAYVVVWPIVFPPKSWSHLDGRLFDKDLITCFSLGVHLVWRRHG